MPPKRKRTEVKSEMPELTTLDDAINRDFALVGGSCGFWVRNDASVKGWVRRPRIPTAMVPPLHQALRTLEVKQVSFNYKKTTAVRYVDLKFDAMHLHIEGAGNSRHIVFGDDLTAGEAVSRLVELSASWARMG